MSGSGKDLPRMSCCRPWFWGLYLTVKNLLGDVSLCEMLPLSVMCKCGSFLDVLLICFAQNEDENRASESKKTKLEEKAPSGHKNSSSREWVSALPCTEGQGGCGEGGAHLPPLLFSLTPSFPQIIGKISFFLTLKQIYIRASTSNRWKLISSLKNTGQGQLCSLTKWGDPSCEGKISFLVFSNTQWALGLV